MTFRELLGKIFHTRTSVTKEDWSKPKPTATPTPTPEWYPIEKNIKKGYKKYKKKYNLKEIPPIASMSAVLAKLGLELEKRGGDAYLPPALAIKETSALQHKPAQIINNPFGIGPHIKYPDLETSILGGGPDDQLGLKGVLENSAYDPYFKSGDLLDFFKTYTPTKDKRNPSYENTKINNFFINSQKYFLVIYITYC